MAHARVSCPPDPTLSLTDRMDDFPSPRPRLPSCDAALTSDALRRLRSLTEEMQRSLERRGVRRSSVPERRSPDGREAGWEEERLPPPLPPQLRPVEKMTPRAGVAAVGARRQQLRRRRQRNLTAAGMEKEREGAGTMRNSVSFCGIHTDDNAASPVFLEPTSAPQKSDSLVDVLHRRYYSHQYIANARARPSYQIASLDHTNLFLQPQTLRLPRRRDIMTDMMKTFPKSKSMNDASLHQGFSADVVEACRWLIEAGFPQYSQMFEDGCFPLDLEMIREDHRFMDEDAISALFRRIDTLNEFAVSQTLRKEEEDSVDGDFLLNKMGRAAFDCTDAGAEVALSRNWQFQRDTRRWSRREDSPPPATNGHARSRAAKRAGTPEEGSGRSLLRSASLRLRTAVSRFRRGDLNFRSLRRAKKPPAATVVVDEPAAVVSPPTPVISAPIPMSQPTPRPMQTSEAMHILVNDTIDTGSGDKINVRTGSFMGKVGHRHEAFLRRRTDASATTPTARKHESSPAGDNAAELDRILQALYSDIDMLDEMMDSGRSPRLTNSSVSAPTSPRLLDVPSSDSCPSSPADVLAQFTEIEAYDLDAQIVELKRLERLRRGDGPRGSLDRGASSSRGHSSERDNSIDSSAAFRSATSTLRRNAPSRWSSVERTWRQSVYQQDQSMAGMSVKQLILLRKIALLKLTTIMEKHCPPHKSLFSCSVEWSLTFFGFKAIPKLLRRGRSHSDADSGGKLFGNSLGACLQRTGEFLPRAILNALNYLRVEGKSAHGIFRRAGGKARTLGLRDHIDKKPDLIDFANWQPYDVADVVKLYFRELPECLLTNKLSSTLINIFLYVPLDLRLEALQWTVLRLPDENRVVLQSLLSFLRDMAEHADVTQMPASNLAMCLAPTLFNFPHALPSGLSPKRLRRVTGSPDPKELAEQKAAHECLTVMINFSHQLFLISESILNQCQFDADELGEPPSLNLLAPPRSDGRDWQSWAGDRLASLLKDCREKGRGWVHIHGPGPETHQRKVNDGLPLKLWRCVVEVEAPPEDLLHRVWNERSRWDPHTLSEETLEVLGEDAEVVRRSLAALAPSHASRDCVLLRARQRGLEGGACALLSSSITHDTLHSPHLPACILQEDLLFEPCGAGKCRVHWLSRVDVRGFTAEWYASSWGSLVSHVLVLLQSSFVKAIQSRETSL